MAAMSRDYKRNDHKPGTGGRGGSFLVGVLVGLVLGLSIALGVAWYINKMPSPFTKPSPPSRSELPKAPPAKDAESTKPEDSKPRFDFYNILPGKGEAATDPQVKEGQKPAAGASKEAFFLQAGAFSNAPEADNLKARLALLGVEATIQTTTLADRGLLHRVRIGPYTNVEELNRTRETLKQNGIQTTLITVREADN